VSHESRLPIINLLFALVRSCDDLIARSLKIEEKVLCSARRQLLSQRCATVSARLDTALGRQRKRALLASEETRFQTKLFASAEAPRAHHIPRSASSAVEQPTHRHIATAVVCLSGPGEAKKEIDTQSTVSVALVSS
jgi:hypothetical protein